ncbi:putative transcriptional regulator [Desulfitobacterium dichloroeliminans LMG P-21439]|uniref:Putative transcriptional regulator n=1 Tax=Desulfitobacterium dichloroeliminans (strain LMG P-21439 / DCA1) TaxID=871963 RepID=L0F6C1_DESDL|nr:metalloregulator ArsR/SmtB family transcription factor [Desulfitobacterium dichloroeliminans]AGA68493.1 putative transcriptional regulator [Desulfitobacterium dichloroeliminans LMG P-21439]
MNTLTNIFKILSDETRLRIIMLLYQQDLCVCELSGILDIPQPKISKSLSKLRDTNLVSDTRLEKFVFYSLKTEDPVLLNTLKTIMENLESYPQLINDRTRLADKEIYLNACNNVKEGD